MHYEVLGHETLCSTDTLFVTKLNFLNLIVGRGRLERGIIECSQQWEEWLVCRKRGKKPFSALMERRHR